MTSEKQSTPMPQEAPKKHAGPEVNFAESQGSFLQRLRKEAGKSVDQAAEAIGKPSITIKRIEIGLTSPLDTELQKLGEEYGVSTGEIVLRKRVEHNSELTQSEILAGIGFLDQALPGVFHEELITQVKHATENGKIDSHKLSPQTRNLIASFVEFTRSIQES